MITSNRRLRAHVQQILAASAFGLAVQASTLAQQAPATTGSTSTTELDTIVVTGSYIRGTPEDAALPVDVISTADLAEQGSPSVVQLVKTITASTTGIGESNRYVGGAGSANINLRGFGPARTLVLMNSRRLADNPFVGVGGGQNLNFVPTAAIGRIEILKEGAAATYGSDAIGGVVNFITRTDLHGLEIEGEYSYIQGSDGDYLGNVAWGHKTDSGNVLLTFGYRHRSRLDIFERDWAMPDALAARYNDPGYGGWTGAGNPGLYVTNSPAGTPIFRDNGCTELGGILTNAVNGRPVSPANPVTATSTCRFQFSAFNDLVNKEDHFQVYGEFNTELGNGIQAHTEVAWNRDYVPQQRISPANLTARFPTPQSLGGTSGSTQTPSATNFFVRYNVPAYHPGLIDLRTTCAAPLTAAQCAAMAAPGGVDISQTVWRAIAFAGHPTNKDKADHQLLDGKAFRVASSLSGELWGVNWDTGITYMQARGIVNISDLLVTRIQLALNGFGSLNGAAPCTSRNPADAGNAALGCYFFNPFTNSVAVSAVPGPGGSQLVNPYYRGNVNPAVNNHPRLVEWLYGNYTNEINNELTVFDAVLTGQTGLELPGGEIGWAFGTQWRYTRERQAVGDFNNTLVNPCVDSIDDGTPVCNVPDSPTIFFGANTPYDLSRSVYAAFAEFSLPVLDSLDASLAVRFESYPGEIGDTTDPKLSLRWQVLDWLAIRASAGTTFRAPGALATSPNCASGVANIAGQYRATLTCGNPNLEPETANAFNGGLLFSPGNFTASIDYYYFDFSKELTVESVSRLFQTMFNVTATNTAGNSLNCGDPAFAPLQARFTFAGGVCSPANVLRIRSNQVNGPATVTSGIDLRLQYDWRDVLGGSLTVGAEATYMIEYDRGAFTLSGAPNIVFSAPEDRAGLHDLVAQFFSYPQLKANVFASFNWRELTVRPQIRYQEGTEAAFGTPTSRWVLQGSDYVQELIGKTDDFIQLDLTFRYQLPWDTVATFSVQNVFDEDPPFAPSQYNYDYTNGNPLGRVFELNLKKKF